MGNHMPPSHHVNESSPEVPAPGVKSSVAVVQTSLFAVIQERVNDAAVEFVVNVPSALNVYTSSY